MWFVWLGAISNNPGNSTRSATRICTNNGYLSRAVDVTSLVFLVAPVAMYEALRIRKLADPILARIRDTATPVRGAATFQGGCSRATTPNENKPKIKRTSQPPPSHPFPLLATIILGNDSKRQQAIFSLPTIGTVGDQTAGAPHHILPSYLAPGDPGRHHYSIVIQLYDTRHSGFSWGSTPPSSHPVNTTTTVPKSSKQKRRGNEGTPTPLSC